MSRIVNEEHLVALRDSMLKTAKEIRADKTKLTDFVSEALDRGNVAVLISRSQNHGVATNHLQSPPLNDPSLLFPDVFSNDFVHQIVRSYLGPDIQMAFITANTALPNTRVRLCRARRTGKARLTLNYATATPTSAQGCTLGSSSGSLHAQHQLPALWYVFT